MTCNFCPLTLPKQVPGHGPSKPRLIVVGESPTSEDELSGIPFSGGGNPRREYPNLIIRKALTALGIDPEDVYFAYALRCNPWHRAEAIKIKPQYLTTCRVRNLEPELERVDCEVILAVGDLAAASLLPDLEGGLHRNRMRWHEVVIGKRRRRIRLTYACNFIEKMSLYRHQEQANGKIVRGPRWNPPGSAGDFFTKDLKAVVAEVLRLENLHKERETA